MQQLKFGITAQFSALFTTQGTGAAPAIFYRPIPAEGYFVLGDYGQANLDPANGTVVTVTEIDADPDDPMLKPPTDYQLIWNGTSQGVDGSFWQPVAPPNYVGLGTIAQFGTQKPSLENYRCVRFDQVKTGSYGPQIWAFGGSSPVTATQILQTYTFYAQTGLTSPPMAPAYVPKDL